MVFALVSSAWVVSFKCGESFPVMSPSSSCGLLAFLSLFTLLLVAVKNRFNLFFLVCSVTCAVRSTSNLILACLNLLTCFANRWSELVVPIWCLDQFGRLVWLLLELWFQGSPELDWFIHFRAFITTLLCSSWSTIADNLLAGGGSALLLLTWNWSSAKHGGCCKGQEVWIKQQRELA